MGRHSGTGKTSYDNAVCEAAANNIVSSVENRIGRRIGCYEARNIRNFAVDYLSYDDPERVVESYVNRGIFDYDLVALIVSILECSEPFEVTFSDLPTYSDLNNMRTDLYDNSPFRYFRNLPPHAKGVAGEHVLEDFVRMMGWETDNRRSREHDLVIIPPSGHEELAEVKTSFKWTEDERFTFQQIRFSERQWSHLYFLEVDIYEIRIYKCERHVAEQMRNDGIITIQHGGMENGSTDLCWLSSTITDELIESGYDIEYLGKVIG